ncbi:MAG: MFS transporter [Solirubrobacterales bacterium]|nr:MFS transporter [Solirubrobacterales bacterium]
MPTTSSGSVVDRLDAIGLWPYRRRVLLVVGAAYFFAFFDVVNIGAALPVIEQQFDISSTTAAMAVSVGLVGYVVGALADAAIADRLGPRKGLVVSVIALIVGGVIAALADGFAMLLVGRFITGMGIGAEIAAAAAYIAGISPAGLRGRAGCTAVSWGYAGLAAAPFIALALVPEFADGWRVMFIIGAVGALVILPLRLGLPPSVRWLIAEGREQQAKDAVVEIEQFAGREGPIPLAKPQPTVAPGSFVTMAALFLGVWFIYYIGNYGWLTLAPTLLTKQGFTLSASLSFLCVTGFGFVVGALLSIRVGERFERKFTIAATLVVYAVALAIIGAEPTPAVVMGFGFIVSATIGLAVPILYVNTAEQFRSLMRARGVASTDGIGHVGGAIAPLLILPAAAAGFFWGMGVMALSGLIAAALVLLGRRMTGHSIS